jgi:hypothetical protein
MFQISSRFVRIEGLKSCSVAFKLSSAPESVAPSCPQKLVTPFLRRPDILENFYRFFSIYLQRADYVTDIAVLACHDTRGRDYTEADTAAGCSLQVA